MSSKEIIAKMVGYFDNISAINDELKIQKDEAKAQGFEPSSLALVAKSISDSKMGKLRGKLEGILDLLDEQES